MKLILINETMNTTETDRPALAAVAADSLCGTKEAALAALAAELADKTAQEEAAFMASFAPLARYHSIVLEGMLSSMKT